MYKTLTEQRNELLRRIRFLLITVVVLLLFGSLFFYLFEDWSFKQAFHYAVISLTSRGYSDFFPQTWPSILFSAAYTLIGLSFVIYSFSTLIAYYISYYEAKVDQTVTKVTKKFKKDSNKRRWFIMKEK